MGSGRWSTDTYASVTSAKVSSGRTFSYSTATASAPRDKQKAHEDLDPVKKNGEGRIVRESRDSDEHPTSKAVAVLFDCTGSMGTVPRTLQQKLPQLFGLLLRKGYIEHPQVLVGAYGDAYCDAVPLQASQFESDNRIDDALDNLFLEGGGGGNAGETLTLGWAFLGAHAELDCLEKRGQKGYLFSIGDEVALEVTAKHLRDVAGIDAETGMTAKQALASAQEKFEVFHLLIDNSTAHQQSSKKFYGDLLGERCIVLDDPATVCESVALLIGMLEGSIELDEGLDHLREIGSGDAAESVGKALATVGAGSGGAVATGDAPEGVDGESGADR